jgi:hypothetical protein
MPGQEATYMGTQRGRLALLMALGVVLAAGGCKKNSPPASETGSADTAASAPAAPAPAEAFAVSEVTLGKKIDADKRIATPTTTFAPRDTIYASVATTGSAPSKTITAKWTYQDGQTVKQEADTIAPTGPASTEFHLAKKSAWPAGKYKLEIAVDGTPATSKEFEVKK